MDYSGLQIIGTLVAMASYAVAGPSQYSIRRWVDTDGLPSNEVRCLAMTTDGFLWLATGRGICRFDGVRFVSVPTEEGNPYLAVKELAEISPGSLLATDTAWRTHSLTNNQFVHNPAAGLGTLLKASDGSSLLIRMGETRRFADGQWATITDSPEWPGRLARSMNSTRSQGLLAILFGKGIWQYDGKQWKLWAEYQEPHSDTGAIMEDSSGSVWLTTQGKEIWKISATSKRVYPAKQSLGPGFSQIVESAPGEIWASVIDGGLWHLEEDQFKEFPLPTGVVISKVIAGKEGDLWLATREHGLIWIGLGKLQSHTLRTINLGGRITGLAELSQGVFATSTFQDGLWKYENGITTPLSDTLDPRLKEYCSGLMKVSNGAIWAAMSNGPMIFRTGNLPQRLNFQNLIEDGDYVSAMAEGADGTVWLGCGSGKILLAKEAEIRNQPRPTSSRINDLEIAPDGAVWVATTHHGVQRMVNGNLEVFGPSSGLADMAVQDLHFSVDGNLWVGMGVAGLYGFSGGKFHHVNTDEGPQQENSVVQIVEDRSGWLWLGGDKGVTGIPIKDAQQAMDGKLKCVDTIRAGWEEARSNKQCLRMEPIRAGDGRINLGTTQGFVSFDPEALKVRKLPPEPILEEVGAGGALWQFPHNGAHFDIGTDGRIQIRFTGVDLLHAEDIKFRFRLQGFDPTWVLENQRVATYSNLPPGEFTFEVMSGNRMGWNPMVKSITVVVQPRYWQTWWFQLLAAIAGTVLVGAGTMAILWLKNRQHRKMRERDQAVNDERTRIARDLHDGLGAGLTQAGLLAEIMEMGKATHAPNPNQILLQTHIRSLVQDLDVAVWTASPRHDKLSSLCSYLVDFATEFFSRSNIKCRVSLPDALRDCTISPKIRHEIFMCAKEAMNNSLKHSGATEFRLDIHQGDVDFKIQLTDNGCGFQSEKINDSQCEGIKNLAERMKTLGGSADVISNLGGTTVSLTVPSFLLESA